MMSESEIQQLIQMEGPKHESIVMRNNSGALKDSTGRMVRYGLNNISDKVNANFKSSDLIGITCITITPNMVGYKIGVFTAVEVKKEDWVFKGTDREKGQKNFIDWVLQRGGFAGFANSVESFRKIIGK